MGAYSDGQFTDTAAERLKVSRLQWTVLIAVISSEAVVLCLDVPFN
jgi:hypothetical protein